MYTKKKSCLLISPFQYGLGCTKPMTFGLLFPAATVVTLYFEAATVLLEFVAEVVVGVLCVTSGYSTLSS